MVIALQRQRATLMAQIAAQPASIVSRTSVAPNPLYQSLKQQAATYRARVEGDKGEIAALKAERAIYAPRFSALPAQAMDFASIRRRRRETKRLQRARNKSTATRRSRHDRDQRIVIVEPATRLGHKAPEPVA